MSTDLKLKGIANGVGRRTFIKLAGGCAAGMFFLPKTFAYRARQAAGTATPVLSKFTETLPIPPEIELTGGAPYSMSMAPGTHSFHASLPATPTWGYGGASYLGPTFIAKRGVPASVTVENDLGYHPMADRIDYELHGVEPTDATFPRAVLHLHGGHVESASDGGPEDTFLPGTSHTYNYINDQEATNLWYHDHALGMTRLNVYAGLAGYYLVRDDWDTGLPDNPIGLPAGEYEVPLVIQDKMFNEDGTLAYPEGPLRAWSPEFFGDVAVVNGKAFPNLDVRAGLYRFRIINGSNARVYDLFLSNNHSFYQIGGDGGLLDAPVPMRRLVIAPGERADLLINFAGFQAGTKIVLRNTAPVPFPDGPRSKQRGGVPLRDIMQFTVLAEAGHPGPVPAALRETPILRLTDPVRVRNISLVEVMDMEEDEPLMALINNLMWTTDDIEEPRANTVEQWNIINTTGDLHPIHLHLAMFQVVSRQKYDARSYIKTFYPEIDMGEDGMGPWPVPSADDFRIGNPRPYEANEAGWKDTVQAYPGDVTTIMVAFGPVQGAPYSTAIWGDYVFHCHILEHEDNEMMVPYRVLPPI